MLVSFQPLDIELVDTASWLSSCELCSTSTSRWEWASATPTTPGTACQERRALQQVRPGLLLLLLQAQACAPADVQVCVCRHAHLPAGKATLLCCSHVVVQPVPRACAAVQEFLEGELVQQQVTLDAVLS